MAHAGVVSNPRQAALESLDKMRLSASLGVPQAVLPPHERPRELWLRRLGLGGSLEQVLAAAAAGDGHLLRLCSSASAMWTANAATVAPSSDTLDGRLHLTVANLTAMFHRSLEADVTERVLAAIFRDERHFAVHAAVPGGAAFADEGAANHTRLAVDDRAVHLFGWGRRTWGEATAPRVFPARQALEASQAVARLCALPQDRVLYRQQHPDGIDAGAFHSDVLAVGNANFLVLHEQAFVDPDQLTRCLAERLGPGFCYRLVSESELPAARAVATYPFNSQLVSLPGGAMALIAPEESQRDDLVRGFLERLVAEDNPLSEVRFQSVAGSMRNGGGPACLRLRVVLSAEERTAIGARVFVDDGLLADLRAWVLRHYRDRLTVSDLADPAFCLEMRSALDELTGLLGLGSVYDFQR
jgi:succinylarginine dihydrolase